MNATNVHLLLLWLKRLRTRLLTRRSAVPSWMTTIVDSLLCTATETILGNFKSGCRRPRNAQSLSTSWESCSVSSVPLLPSASSWFSCGRCSQQSMTVASLPGLRRKECWPNGILERILFSNRPHLHSRILLMLGNRLITPESKRNSAVLYYGLLIILN